MADLRPDLLMNAIDAKRERVGLEGLSEVERTVTLLSYARFEFDLGGLSGFFYNTTGDFAEETAWALDQVGARETAEALRQAAVTYQREEQAALGSTWEETLADDHAAIEAVNSRFDEARDCDDLDELLDRYIRQHQAELSAS